MKTIEYNSILLHIPERYYIKNLLDRFTTKTHEKDEVEASIKFIKNTDTVLELGSCVGYLACVISKYCNYIYSIEANPELDEALQLTKNKNNINNITFINGILTENKEPILFHSMDIIVGGSTNRDDISKYNTVKHYIKPISIYNIKDWNKISVLIIDIEGGELELLKEYNEFIKNQIETIIIELHGRFMKDPQFNQKCINIINNCGLKYICKLGLGTFIFKK